MCCPLFCSRNKTIFSVQPASVKGATVLLIKFLVVILLSMRFSFCTSYRWPELFSASFVILPIKTFILAGDERRWSALQICEVTFSTFWFNPYDAKPSGAIAE